MNYEEATKILLDHIMLWPGWKIHIPVNQPGVASVIREHTHKEISGCEVHVGDFPGGKMNTVIITDPLEDQALFELHLANAASRTARDGEICMLWPTNTIASLQSSIQIQNKEEAKCNVIILPPFPEPMAWFVYHRKNTGKITWPDLG